MEFMANISWESWQVIGGTCCNSCLSLHFLSFWTEVDRTFIVEGKSPPIVHVSSDSQGHDVKQNEEKEITETCVKNKGKDKMKFKIFENSRRQQHSNAINNIETEENIDMINY
jgi:hypothetical protein